MTSIQKHLIEIYENDGYEEAIKYFFSNQKDLKKLSETEYLKLEYYVERFKLITVAQRKKISTITSPDDFDFRSNDVY